MAAAKSALRLFDMRAWALLWVVMMVQQHGSATAKGLSPPHKGTVRTIQSVDGDIVDCVLKHQQPAFNHPLLVNHTIQEFPSSIPVDDQTIQSEQSSFETFQVWHKKERCPSGTIPIIRKDPTQVVHKKYFHPTSNTSRQILERVGTGHEYGVAIYRPPANTFIYGSSVVLNLWDPYVEANSNEFSLSQIWIIAGSYENNNLNTIEVGWQVSPQQYNDKRARLFIYWTADAYSTTGCYNMLCSGFVQVDNTIAFGGSLQADPSIYKGAQVELPRILVWKDQQTQNWWLRYGSTNIGYWPKELFTTLANHAEILNWGGEVVNRAAGGSHTSTQMGSGHFADEGFQGACYSRSLTFIDSTNTLSSVPLQDITTTMTNAYCYDIKAQSVTNWGTSIFFGGPGKNPNCP